MHKLQTLVLLLVAYLAATWFPGPGLAVRDWELLTSSIHPPEVFLAVMLFCAGLCSSKGALKTILATRDRFAVLAIASWLLPLASALIVVVLLWGLLGCPPSVALGIVIVAAMPVANSSVGWATSMGGSVTLSIALLVVGTALSPLLTPLAIGAGAISLGTAEHALTQTPWSDGMGAFFLTWVLTPVLLGILVAGRLRAPVGKRVIRVARRVSFVILILLNYLNGAPCLPALAEQPQLLLWPVLGALSLLLCSFAGSQFWPQLVKVQPAPEEVLTAERVSLMLSVVMRNTGAALVFAGAALPDYVSVSLTIIAYTMLQHFWVGFFLSQPTPAEH